MMRTISIRSALIDETLAHLRVAGARGTEGVVLWLAPPDHQRLVVASVFVPAYEADEDYFRVPPAALDELLRELRMQRSMVAAQVHSHPAEAFHSKADDEWAIVRHEGALSIVVPHFARDMSSLEFRDDVAIFSLTAGRWREVKYSERPSRLEVTT